MCVVPSAETLTSETRPKCRNKVRTVLPVLSSLSAVPDFKSDSRAQVLPFKDSWHAMLCKSHIACLRSAPRGRPRRAEATKAVVASARVVSSSSAAFTLSVVRRPRMYPEIDSNSSVVMYRRTMPVASVSFFFNSAGRASSRLTLLPLPRS